MSHGGAQMQMARDLHVSAKRDLVASTVVVEQYKWVSHLEGTPRREFVCRQAEVCVDTPSRRVFDVTRPAHVLRAAPRQSRVRLQTCLRSDRRSPRLARWRTGSSARTRSCCCCTRAREQEARPPARTHLSAPRRRGGAELSGKVRCHARGCASKVLAPPARANIDARCVNTTVPGVPSGCQALSGCPAACARSSETLLRHALHLLSALSGCRHASVIAAPGIARRQSVTRACSAGLRDERDYFMIARTESGMCLVRVCRSETTGPAPSCMARFGSSAQTRPVLGS